MSWASDGLTASGGGTIPASAITAAEPQDTLTGAIVSGTATVADLGWASDAQGTNGVGGGVRFGTLDASLSSSGTGFEAPSNVASASADLASSGPTIIDVWPSLNLPAGQAAGTYTGSITVTVSLNT
jgi:hypothetical protein